MVFHESECCKNSLINVVENISQKILVDIFKIKNPNESIYELMKLFFLILSDNSQNAEQNSNISWLFLKSNLKTNNIKRELEDLIAKDVSKELIDQCMPFNIKYNEIKTSLVKVNKNLLLILDFIKSIVDYNIKKNIVKNLYSSNLNKTSKVNMLREHYLNKEALVKNASDYLSTMQSELTSLLAQVNIYLLTIEKFNLLISQYNS